MEASGSPWKPVEASGSQWKPVELNAVAFECRCRVMALPPLPARVSRGSLLLLTLIGSSSHGMPDALFNGLQSVWTHDPVYFFMDFTLGACPRHPPHLAAEHRLRRTPPLLHAASAAHTASAAHMLPPLHTPPQCHLPRLTRLTRPHRLPRLALPAKTPFVAIGLIAMLMMFFGLACLVQTKAP